MEQRWSESLPFRAFQTPILYQAVNENPYSPGKGRIHTRMIIVGSEHDIISQGFDGVRYYSLGRDAIRSNISAPVDQLGLRLLVPTIDGTIYAFQADRGLALWTFNVQGVPAVKPATIAPDVFVTTTNGQLFRLNADDGTPPKPQDGLFAANGSYSAVRVKQFLSASDRTVFALNPLGKLLVVDRKRGTVRGSIDMAGYNYTPVNDITDRAYLASNDGKLICLYDPAQPRPKQYRPSIHRRFENEGKAAGGQAQPMDSGR